MKPNLSDLPYVVINENTRNAIAALYLPGDAVTFLAALLKKNHGRNTYDIIGADGAALSNAMQANVAALHAQARDPQHAPAPTVGIYTFFTAQAVADRDAVRFETIYVGAASREQAIEIQRRRTAADRMWLSNIDPQELITCRVGNAVQEMSFDALDAWIAHATTAQPADGDTRPPAATEIPVRAPHGAG